MKKVFMRLFALVVLCMVLMTGVLLFSYTKTGNALLQRYIEARLQQETKLPVKVHQFIMDSHNVKLLIGLNRQLKIEFVSHYSLWSRSFDGIYRINAKQFSYKDIRLRTMDIRGTLKGTPWHFRIDGSGTAFDAPLMYKVLFAKMHIRQIEAKMHRLSLSEILALAGEKNIVSGKVDVDINMPNIGKKGAKGYGYITLYDGLLNRSMVQNLYGYTLPKKSYVSAKAEMKLKGVSVDFKMDAKSNLFSIDVAEGKIDLHKKEGLAQYALDIRDLRILSENKLAGPLRMHGKIAWSDSGAVWNARSHSLGGRLEVSMADKIAVHLENIALEKLCRFARQPVYAKGFVSGEMELEKSMRTGAYSLKIDKGILQSKQIEKHLGYLLPADTHFNISSRGDIKKHTLQAQTHLRSSLLNATLDNTKYAIKTKHLHTDYKIEIEDIGLWIPTSKKEHGGIQAEGKLAYTDRFTIDGTTHGLAKRLHFHYDAQKATLDAEALMLQKVLALGGMSPYLNGPMDIQIDIENTDILDGTFSLKGKHLTTQPKAIQAILGKALKMDVSIQSKGRMKKGVLFAEGKVQTEMGRLVLSHIVADGQKKRLKSAYVLDIPDMQKLYALTDKKLYGKMHIEGKIEQNDVLRATGTTHSLGGEIVYRLEGRQLRGKIHEVPIENMMGMMGLHQTVLGKASGTVRYNLQTQKGVADIVIGAFQIRPNKTTNMVKMLIGKDPARIIFKHTKVHALRSADIVTYTLHATGTRASVDITHGRFNIKTRKHSARFKFVYESYVISGDISGSADNPKISIDAKSMMQGKVKKEIKRGLDKVLNGKMGELFKGLRF